MNGAEGLRIGVIVPCRNEARVIARRLANLRLSRLPEGIARPHLVVVDDGSSDETRALALSGCEGMSGWSAEVIANVHAQGKNGAVRTGLDHLGAMVDVVVLTDADVITNVDALSAIAAAFMGEAALGLATGVQRLHESLPVEPRELDGGDAMGLYDSWTRRVRRYESRRGRLFSVHGQLLAWRVELGLSPGTLAADDLELMLELRRSHPERSVRMIEGAVFHEERSPARADQDLRRARAYLQALPMMRASGLGAQAWFYSRVPVLAPLITGSVLSIAALSVGVVGGAVMLSLFIAALALMMIHPATRRLFGLLIVIERARRAERAESLSASWETARA
jgi:glycosyltransferase involved in cell wall biosynthesis